MKHKYLEDDEENVDDTSEKRQRLNDEVNAQTGGKHSPENGIPYSESILDSASVVDEPNEPQINLTEQEISDLLSPAADENADVHDDKIKTPEKPKQETNDLDKEVDGEEIDEQIEDEEGEIHYNEDEDDQEDEDLVDEEENDEDDITYLETKTTTVVLKEIKKFEDGTDAVVEEVLTWNDYVVNDNVPNAGVEDVYVTVDDTGFDWKVVGVVPASNTEKTYKEIEDYRSKHFTAFKNFNNMIWKHLQLNYQNDSTFSWKMRMRKMLHEFIANHYEKTHLVAVGSTVNGCGSYNSDMDLCLCIPDPLVGYNTDRTFATKTLKFLAARMRRTNFGIIHRVQFISAKVPILKLTFQPPYDELEVDLNCNNVAGIYNSHLLHYYARIDDRFPALCLLVKHWAIKHEINDAQTGTFNSYSLILMVLHFLQCVASPPILPNLQKLYPETFTGEKDIEQLGLFMELPYPLPDHPKNERTVGELLIAFFDYYARFDFESLGISVARACTFNRWILPENTQRYRIFIEEPFDLLNTARCVTHNEMYTRIKKAFKTTRSAFLGPIAKPPNLKNIRVDV